MSKVEDLVRFVGLKYRFSKDNEAENSLQICKEKIFVIRENYESLLMSGSMESLLDNN